MARQKEGYWEAITEAVKANDLRKLKKLIAESPNDADIALWRAADEFVSAELSSGPEAAKENLGVLKTLADALYAARDESDWSKYVEYLTGLDSVKQDQWSRARESFGTFIELTNKALVSKKAEDCDAALEKSDPVIKAFEAVSDNYMLGWCTDSVGSLYYTKADYAKAEETYKTAITFMQNFGGKKGESFVKAHLGEAQRSAALLKSKADKDAKSPDKSKPEGEGESGWTAVRFNYKLDDKPIATPNPLTTEEYVLWSEVVVTKSAPADFSDNSASQVDTFSSYYQQTTQRNLKKDSPIAKTQFLLDKGKVYFDKNDNGKCESEEKLKASTKPGPEEFEIPLGEGKTYKYATNMVALGKEKFFNFDTTYGNKDTVILHYQRACHMEGEFLGKKITLIDDSNNATYDDYGADSMIIGNGAPQFLSRIFSLDGKFYVLKPVDALGSEVRIKEWTGDTGSVALKWKGGVQPKYLYIRGMEGDGLNGFFNLDPKAPIKVPTGNYTFYFGLIKEGTGRRADTIEIRQGKSKTFAVKANETATVELGAPFEYDFRTTPVKEKVTLKGRDLRIYGKSGELYTRLYPDFPIPEIEIKREKGGLVGSDKFRPVESADYNKDTTIAWYPKDFEFDPKGQKGKFIFKLTADFKLLGKITSEFKE
ncbi:MAG: hypothetical protein HYR85_10795, partial [Planctomycetes bacterium]|nr:hypothetical protein [Planctomycetota bacterium]